MSIQKADAKIRFKRSLTTGTTASIAPSFVHTDGSWNSTDIYIGEPFLNAQDERLYIRTNHGIREIDLIGASGSSDYLTSDGGTMSGDLVMATGSGIKFGSGNSMVFKEIEIGDWDMDTSSTTTVAHGLSGTEWKTVRNMAVTVRDDSDANYYNQHTSDVAVGQLNVDSTNFNLRRDVGSIYDGSSFNATSYNRGWVTFFYNPD